MSSSERLYDALSALRSAENPSARDLDPAWRVVSDHLDARRLPDREHDDVRQRTLVKVFRAVAGMSADDPRGAEAWLGTVRRSARMEHHRSRGTRMMNEALRTTPREGDVSPLDRIAAPIAERTEEDARRLDAVLEQVLEYVHGWLARNVPRPVKRAGDYRRAQIALLANVRGLDVDALRAEAGIPPDTSKATIYKWIERGREQVLLPALESWDAPLAEGLAEVLRNARRGDAGRPRPARRRGPVSPPTARASRGKKGGDRS